MIESMNSDLKRGVFEAPLTAESGNFSNCFDTNSFLVRVAARLIVSAESNDLTPEFARQQVASMWAAVKPDA